MRVDVVRVDTYDGGRRESFNMDFSLQENYYYHGQGYTKRRRRFVFGDGFQLELQYNVDHAITAVLRQEG